MKKVILLFGFCVFGLISHAQWQMQFVNYEGKKEIREAGDYLFPLEDGNFHLFAGSEDSLIMLKYEPTGNILSRNSYAPEGHSEVTDINIVERPNGLGYYAYIRGYEYFKGWLTCELIEIDMDLNVTNTQEITLDEEVELGSGFVYINEAGNLLFSFFKNLEDEFFSVSRVMELTPDYDTIWYQDYVNPNHSYGSFKNMIETEDNYLFLGVAEAPAGTYDYKIWIVVADKQGNVMYENIVMPPTMGRSEHFLDVEVIGDYFYISTYYYTMPFMATGYTHIYKFNMAGDMIDVVEIGSDPNGIYDPRCITKINDHEMLVGGHILETTTNTNKAWVFRLSSSLEILDEQRIELRPGWESFRDIVKDPEYNYWYATGTAQEYNSNDSDLFFGVFTDYYTGFKPLNISENDFSINTRHGEIVLSGTGVIRDVECNIYDLSGREIMRNQIPFETFKSESVVSVPSLSGKTVMVRCMVNGARKSKVVLVP